MIKKILSIFLIISVILGISEYVNAAEVNTKLQVIKESAETENTEDTYGKINKTIIASDETTGEVTVEVKITNTNNNGEDDTKIVYDNTEIFFMVPESEIKDGRYNEEISEKLDEYFTYIEEFANKVFERNTKVKIGIIGISGPDDSAVNGSETDSEILVNLTNDIETIKSGRSKIPDNEIYFLNLQSAIRLAKQSYSQSTNKILISLFDNTPKSAIGICNEAVRESDQTWEDVVDIKINSFVSNTKAEMLSLKDSNIDFILLRPDNTSFNQKWYHATTNELVLDFDGSSYVQDLYGSIDNPTYGKMYSLNNDNLQRIITEYMYNDVIEKIGTSINNVKIIDYFPQDVIDNFDITILDSNVGQVSDSVDIETRSITWNIETLNGNESATLQYKLKIKDMKNANLIDKVINTNEKITVTYSDEEDTQYEIMLSTSPQIQLVKIKENPEVVDPQPGADTSQSDRILPDTGENIIYITSTIVLLLIGIVTFKKIRDMKDIK